MTYDDDEKARLEGIKDGTAFRDPREFTRRLVLSMALAPPHHSPTLVRRRDTWVPRALTLLRGWRR